MSWKREVYYSIFNVKTSIEIFIPYDRHLFKSVKFDNLSNINVVELILKLSTTFAMKEIWFQFIKIEDNSKRRRRIITIESLYTLYIIIIIIMAVAVVAVVAVTRIRIIVIIIIIIIRIIIIIVIIIIRYHWTVDSSTIWKLKHNPSSLYFNHISNNAITTLLTHLNYNYKIIFANDIIANCISVTSCTIFIKKKRRKKNVDLSKIEMAVDVKVSQLQTCRRIE